MSDKHTGPRAQQNEGSQVTGQQAETPGVKEGLWRTRICNVFYPQGKPIPFLKVTQKHLLGEVSWGFVIKVRSTFRKEGDIIAQCSIEEGASGRLCFSVGVDDPGHLELCQFLAEKGMTGRFRDWLDAQQKGHEWEGWYPGIGFELAPSAVSLDEWSITFPTEWRSE